MKDCKISQNDFQVMLDFLWDNVTKIVILKNFADLQRTRKFQAFEKLCHNSSKELHYLDLVASIWELKQKYYSIH